MAAGNQFELVLSGITGDSETRERVKQVLIEQLSFNEQGVEVFLDNVPIAIKKADEDSHLKAVLDALLNAGAQAHINAPVSIQAPETINAPETDPASGSINIQLDEAPKPASKKNSSQMAMDREAKLSDLIAKKTPKESPAESAAISGAVKSPSTAIKAPSAAVTAPQSKGPSRFVLLGGLVAVLGLIGFWLIPADRTPGRTSIGHIDKPKPSAVSEAKPTAAETKPEQTPAPTAAPQIKASWKIEHDFPDQKILGTLLLSDGKVIGGEFQVSTPPPRELMPEEIVRGLEKDPWVQKLKTMTISFKHLEDGSFEGTGRAKGTIDSKDKITPVFCDFFITGKIDPESKVLIARTIFRSGMDDSGEDRIVKAQLSESGFNYIVAANVDGAKVEEPSPL